MATKDDKKENDIYAPARAALSSLTGRYPSNVPNPVLARTPDFRPPIPPAHPADAPAATATPAAPARSQSALDVLSRIAPSTAEVLRGADLARSDAFQVGGFPAAAGQVVRAVPATAVGVADDALTGLAHVLDPAANFLKTVVTGDPTPIGQGQRTAAVPSAAAQGAPAAAAPAAAGIPAPAALRGPAPAPAKKPAASALGVLAPGTGYFINNTTGRRVDFSPHSSPEETRPGRATQEPTALEALRRLGTTNRATANAVTSAIEADQRSSGQRRINAAADRLATLSDPEQVRDQTAKLLALQGKDPSARYVLSRIQTGTDSLGNPVFESIPFNQQTGEFALPNSRQDAPKQEFVEGQIYADASGKQAVYRNGKFVEIK